MYVCIAEGHLLIAVLITPVNDSRIRAGGLFPRFSAKTLRRLEYPLRELFLLSAKQ